MRMTPPPLFCKIHSKYRFIIKHVNVQRRLKSIRENKMADVNEFELLLFAPLKYTR
jgi:hypothetical protein